MRKEMIDNLKFIRYQLNENEETEVLSQQNSKLSVQPTKLTLAKKVITDV